MNYEEWMASRAEKRARCERIDALLPPPKREKPRDPDEAEVLRRLGVGEELIGPVPDRDQLARVRDLLRERLRDEQAAERWLWYRPDPRSGGCPPVVLLLEGRFDELLELAAQA